MSCTECGADRPLSSLCPTCGKRFCLTCFVVHRKLAHGYKPSPEEEYRSLYLYRLHLLPDVAPRLYDTSHGHRSSEDRCGAHER